VRAATATTAEVDSASIALLESLLMFPSGLNCGWGYHFWLSGACRFVRGHKHANHRTCNGTLQATTQVNTQFLSPFLMC
jgi:hypothetical protein